MLQNLKFNLTILMYCRSHQDDNQNISQKETVSEPPIYNYVSSVEKPLTWKEFMSKCIHEGYQVPTKMCFHLKMNTSIIVPQGN